MSSAAMNLNLTPPQLIQQTDVARRLLNLAYLGTPRVQSEDPNMPALLALHVISCAYLAVAEMNPGITDTASGLAFDMSHHLKTLVEQRGGTSH